MKALITIVMTFLLLGISCISIRDSRVTSQPATQPHAICQHYTAVENGSLTDINGNTYKTVIIGDQVWMAENLMVTNYRNGDPIPNISSGNEWENTENTSLGAYCQYRNNKNYANIYGNLYNWHAINDPRSLAPEGWHVPTKEEWNKLIWYCGGFDIASIEMKEMGNKHWKSVHQKLPTNSLAFTAIPGGFRSSLAGEFRDIGYNCRFWTSTEQNSGSAWEIRLDYKNSPSLGPYGYKNYGYSIRCIKD